MCPEPGRIANSQAPGRGQISTTDAAGAWICRAGSRSSSFSLPLGVLQKAWRSPTARSLWYNSVRVERPTVPAGLVWEFLWGLRHPCGDYQYIPSSQAQRHETEHETISLLLSSGNKQLSAHSETRQTLSLSHLDVACQCTWGLPSLNLAN